MPLSPSSSSRPSLSSSRSGSRSGRGSLGGGLGGRGSGPSFSSFSSLLSLPVLGGVAAVLLVGGGIFVYRSSQAGRSPIVNMRVAQKALGKTGALSVDVSLSPKEGEDPAVLADGQPVEKGLSHVKIEMAQGDVKQILVDEDFPVDDNGASASKKSYKIDVNLEKYPQLKEGAISFAVTATGTGALFAMAPVTESTTTNRVVIGTPRVQFNTGGPIHVMQGGVELVQYRMNPSPSAKAAGIETESGVKVGDVFFRGYPLPNGGPDDYFAFFAIPYDADALPPLQIVAKDELGNEANASFTVEKFFPKPVGSDVINLNDNFINKVVSEIYGELEGGHDPAKSGLSRTSDMLKNYLQLNGDLRQKDNAFLVEISKQSQAKFLWNSVFAPMGNTAIKGKFADKRSYVYNGQQVDTQYHLGFDLASYKQDMVPASNSGVVVFTGYLGIYGNTVIIDHGYGLMTLYAHLSSFAVKEGDTVARMQPIAKTGATGMAGGDHLHFTTMLQGIPVNPIEWWDDHWITDRIAKKLGAAFAYQGGQAVKFAPPPQSAKPTKPPKAAKPAAKPTAPKAGQKAGQKAPAKKPK